MIRHLSGIAVVLLVAGFLASLYWAVPGLTKKLSAPPLEGFVVPEIPQASAKHLETVARLRPVLPELERLGSAHEGNDWRQVELGVFGYSPREVVAAGSPPKIALAVATGGASARTSLEGSTEGGSRDTTGGSDSPPKADPLTGYRLTLSALGPDGRLCVIDGMIYQEGGKLPGGEKINKIQPGRVQIAYGKEERWLQIAADDNPLEAPAIDVVDGAVPGVPTGDVSTKRLTKGQSERLRHASMPEAKAGAPPVGQKGGSEESQREALQAIGSAIRQIRARGQ